jgi:hypothetical protein
MRLLRRSASIPPREREPLLPRLSFIKQEFPRVFDISLQEDADWAVFRRVPGRAGA